MKHPESKFPKINFWDRASERITIINPGDFWKKELFSKLRLKESSYTDSMGASNRSEVLERQQTMKLLHENPELRKFVKSNINVDIPVNGQDFLDEFNPNKLMTPFIKKLKLFVSLLEKANTQNPLMGKIAKLFSFLNENIEQFKKTESDFGGIMGQEIEKASKLHGRTTFLVTEDSIENEGGSTDEGFGYRHFSFKLSENFRILLNSKSTFWQDNYFWYIVLLLVSIIVFPIGIAILIHNRKFRRAALEPMIIEEVPEEVEDDIKEFLEKVLIHEPFKAREKAMAEKGKRSRNLPEFLSFRECKSGTTYIEVYYNYDKNGLHIRILRVYSKTEGGRYDHYVSPVYDSDFAGYSASYVKMVKEKSEQLAEDATSQVAGYDRTLVLLNYIHELRPRLLSEDIDIASPKTDSEYKYYTVTEAINLPHIKESYMKVMEHRDFVHDFLTELGCMAELLESVLKCSEEWNIPVEYPTILPDGEHVIGFETIYPIHLIGRKASDNSIVKSTDLVPINSLPPLNGQLVGLTGSNGGGKTSTLSELTYLIYLAQSGLPVFGTNVKLNVKTTIGLVFNTRAEGSQLQNFLFKAKNVLREIAKTSPNSAVVFLDELGSGAQHEDGIELGKKILKALHQSGVSTIYNTQIPEVASYSEKELNALCFQFTPDHQVRKGIGVGNASFLAKQVGIDKFFV